MTRPYSKRRGDYSGEKNNNAKLTSKQVARVRQLHRKGYTSTRIAKIMGVEASTIRKITTRASWKKNKRK